MSLVIGSSVIALTLVLARAGSAEAPEPCTGEFLGAGLSHSLLEISFANNALKLLNGKESPRLKRLIESQFVSSIASARRQIEGGAVADRGVLPALVPNWLGTIEKAQAYVSTHQLAVLENMSPRGNDGKPAENLAVIREWLKKQPTTYASE